MSWRQLAGCQIRLNVPSIALPTPASCFHSVGNKTVPKKHSRLPSGQKKMRLKIGNRIRNTVPPFCVRPVHATWKEIALIRKLVILSPLPIFMSTPFFQSLAIQTPFFAKTHLSVSFHRYWFPIVPVRHLLIRSAANSHPLTPVHRHLLNPVRCQVCPIP